MKRWTLWSLGAAAALVAGLVACPQFAPDDVCGYPGFCGDSSVGDGGPDAPAGCDLSKEPKDSIACVASSVGVFVDANSGNDSNDGSKQNPVKTISHAIDLAKQKSLPRLYLCEGIFAEDVTLDTAHDGISIFGGWTCADWTYSGNKPTIGKTTTAFKLDTLTKTIFVEDVAIQAANAQNAGESSVGMWINGCANVNIVRDSIVAGSAKDGADGTTTIVSMPDAGTLKGNDTDGGLGAAANTVNCAAGGTTQGGKGGDVAIGGDAGLPALGGGAGGLGGATSCSSGQDGNSASSGSDGPGATAQGQLDSTGWSPGAGSTGTPGSPGQGGGGGGGVGGASFGGGGGGGAGGCGGAGGAAGGGGGGSIAMLVFNSGVTLTTTTLVATTAGNGGKGDAGQLGQAPGGHFGSSVNGCRGGNGGNGGNGGAGGGGAGGLSVGVLWKGPNAPTLDAQTLSTSKFGNAGIKGVGGSAGINDGVAGIAKAVLQVP